MNRTLRTTLLTATLLPLLAACGQRDATAPAPPGNDPAAPTSALGNTVKQAMDEARKELAKENIDISRVHVGSGNVSISRNDDPDRRGKAEITPQGDLLIEGRKVATNAEQHALLLKYRGQVETIANAGMDLGVQGADLASKAVGEALAGVFSGNTDQIEQRIEAQADKIEASALKLCEQMPAMLATQQALAASLPEFKPYATMEQQDIDDCRKDRDDSPHRGRNIREEIREGIRDSVRAATPASTSPARQ